MCNLNAIFVLKLTFVSAYLLNANLPLFALKFKNTSFKDNAMRYIFLIIGLVLIITMKFMAIPLIILFYVVSSVIQERL